MLKSANDMFKQVKCITNRNPTFLKEAYKYSNLVDLQNDERFIEPNEKFIQYDGVWQVWRMPKDKRPKLVGRFDNLMSAVYRARLGV